MSTERANGTGLRTVTLPGGEEIPVLGVGTWGMAERPGHRPDEIAALQMAVDLGMTVIDTAEMYADGAAEELVAEALGGRRGEIFLVSKVLPQHATRRGTVSACEASLRRLRHGSSRPAICCTGAARCRSTRRSEAFERARARREKSGTGASATSTSTTWRSSSRLTANGDRASRATRCSTT